MNPSPHRRLISLGLLPVLALPRQGWPVPEGGWAEWGDAAWDAAQLAVRQWQRLARLRDVRISGPHAHGGRVVGPSLQASMVASMHRRGVPGDAAERFAGALAAAWAQWHEALRVPGLPWYPAFAAFPGPKAVPTPNVPTPLAALVSEQASQLTPMALRNRIVAALGDHVQQPGAAAAVDRFAHWFAARFQDWRATVVVKGVIGSGPVPSFNPPQASAGPVAGGQVLEATGVFATPPF